MCGITAVFGRYENKSEFIQSSLACIRHRGTSQFEIRVFKEGALGANRLPIVDRDNGQQPFSNEDDSIYAVQNGEIFNYQELKSTLQDKGHKFKSDCDTEVLVHLYEEYGTSMLQHIDSEIFAFIIYDKKNERFFVARDRYGLKPLYYAKVQNTYFFGSEMKQLVQFDFIKEITEFPKGHYMVNGKLCKYYECKAENSVVDANIAKARLTELIVEAVKKRVNTDLPIAVLLSGGVDSSLIMEIATRFHKNVTAFILGRPGSPDYESAIRLCKDYHYNYQVVYPEVNYDKEIETLIYHLELYEAQVIRQSFALDLLSKAVVRAGFRIALVGDASDEIFAGYNEFSNLTATNVNKGCLLMLDSLARGHNMRLDRMSMKHTLEIRAPFFDNKIVDYALKIDGKLKFRRENHQITTKYILRKVAEEFLPEYITMRYKVPFSNGAGMNVGYNYKTQDGDVAKQILASRAPKIKRQIKERYGFITDEESAYFNIYEQFKFNKLSDNWIRITTKDNLALIEKQDDKTRVLVAEFGRLALYYPIYFASKAGIYERHNLDVDFISTGGDDLTYNSLLNGSAQVGIADPVFTFANNAEGVNGKIAAQLIGKVPFCAITFNPTIQITNLADFKKYTVGTFQKFSTCHTLMTELLTGTEIKAFPYDILIDALKHKEIDVAIVLPEQAYDLLAVGGHIVFSFENIFNEYLLTGINISNNLDEEYQDAVISFISAIKESVNVIKNNKERALNCFIEEFPGIHNHELLFSRLINFWNRGLTISRKGLNRSIHSWKKVYPWLLKSNMPQFIENRQEDEIIKVLTEEHISRDIPYLEDNLRTLIADAIKNKKPIRIIGYWGASNKRSINDEDIATLKTFILLNDNVKKLHAPGIEPTFILADEHARLNGFNRNNYLNYLKEMSKQISSHGFKFLYLSQLWKEAGIKDNIIHSSIKGVSDTEWNDLSISIKLEKSAMHLGFSNFKNEAKRYYVIRKMESRLIAHKFKNMFFFTHSDGSYQSMLPDMPTIYLRAGKHGKQILPWFSEQNE